MISHELITHAIDLSPLAIPILLAFSRQVRRLIRERDKVDVWDGCSEKTEVAHIDHNKNNPNYNDASNGRLLKPRNHYLDHYNRAGRNGLSNYANIWALRKIWERLSDEDKIGLPPPP